MRTRRATLRWIVRAALVGLALLVALLVFRTHQPGWRHEPSAMARHLVPHLHHLGGSLDAGAGERMQKIFPEGYVFSHAMMGLAWVRLGMASAPGSELRTLARDRSLHTLRALESTAGTDPFPADLPMKHGIFYAGWTNQVRVGAVRLVGAAGVPPHELRGLRASCDAIAAAVDGSETPFLESYPGQAWPADSVVAVSSLAQCNAALETTAYTHTYERWLSLARTRTDPELDVIGHSARSERGMARGTSLALILHFLPDLDPAWAKHHYRVFATHFITTRAGLPVVQEFSEGRLGSGDVDSGPLPFGVSFSATVVGAGAARLHGDHDFADAVFGLGDGVGLQTPSPRGRTWALGLLPLGEAFVAWSKAAPLGVHAATPSGVPGSRWRLWWELPLWALVAALLWLGILGLRSRTSTDTR